MEVFDALLLKDTGSSSHCTPENLGQKSFFLKLVHFVLTKNSGTKEKILSPRMND